MRQFKLNPSRGWKKNEDFMPPPLFSNDALPFNWTYQQNAHLVTSVNENTGEITLVNTQKSRKTLLQYLPADIKTIPSSSPHPPPKDEAVRMVLARVTEALEERPIWTRRALGNRIGHEKFPIPIIKALHHAVYQFKKGPFRDTLIKYGVDPRTDPKYRKYQTLFFKLIEEDEGALKQWKDSRTALPLERNIIRTDTTTHIFDGKTFASDGKVWQLCDITDPLLRRVIDTAQLRDHCDTKRDGYFSNGAMAKIQAIMRMMLIAIRARVPVSNLDFRATIDFPDVVENNNKNSNRISVPLPEVRLPPEVARELAAEGMDLDALTKESIKKRGRKKRTARITRKLATDKENYVRRKSLGANDAELIPKESESKANRGQTAPDESSGVSILNNSQVHQVSAPIDKYMTVEENGGRAGNRIEDDEEAEMDDDEEQESDDDDSEDSEGGDGESESDRGEEDRESGEEGDDWDSDTTDIVDPPTFQHS
jgi:general transcription factor 3C polypeptide 5 (transcription factor C subunit 1)